ncbi:FMN-binding glutamate synthase family protein [Polaribacter pectinis]|uniref:FMN-binding glutamate synthase family protein n=1 Tax=Polaribacter pectinis TaxID=2738844 RepID=A0A7G9L6E9_9FLAO|nr:FMN-binding glutamate synthase family protein [Polaribacter pectinis]QNM84198.1 FMN-binding glutamate synthase family protein [Polaribacter pectinis]
MRNTILFIIILITVLFGVLVYFIPQTGTIILLSISGLLTLIAIHDSLQTKHSLLRAFPLVARLRWFFEEERDKIQQYFIEDNLNGTPINREKRSIVYQRSKLQKETVPFGTQHNVYAKGYEFVKHSMFPKDHHHIKGERIVFGSDKCTQKYDGSIINISAMSFGSLSKNAIKALNQGAKMANFAHNTGEGGISPYHLQGGDLIFQVGTGYFGAGKYDAEGKRVFDDEIFKQNAIRPEVKMIEIKFSQGAKPGHGGILPAKKNTEEIAKIRSVVPYTQVDSPPGHSAFLNYEEMISFIQKVRDLSGGKPVGIKFCVGNNEEIESMIKAFATANNYPDFISVDGGEGGTGSAPMEFTNYIGTPLIEGLVFVNKLLQKHKLKDQIKIIASGKAIDAFDIVRYLALGADAIGMARSFMLSLGCIQARECNLDTCPVGVATQDPDLVKALVVEKKNVRVKNYHDKTVQAVKEMVAAMGEDSIENVKAAHIFRRRKDEEIVSLETIYYN